MRTRHYLLSTLKEIPTDAEVISHQLMLRAGLIRQVAAGLYTWLPTGLRVLRKIEAIVREEMNAAGAIEISMPVVQPSELWRETERWEQYGPELLRFTDRHQRWFVLGPTHEEVVTHLVRSEISSYKQLPLNLYQIQTKFRDEIRPRFGVMRAREFMMKDSYSFHTSQASLQTTYETMYQAYQRIFTRLGLDFRAVQADTGSIGGNYSHEFQVLADNGEDQIVFSSASDYAANIELASALQPSELRGEPQQALQLVDAPQLPTLGALAHSLNLPLNRTVKTIIVQGNQPQTHPWVALLLRGDHPLNEIKAEKLPLVACPLKRASAAEIRALVGAEPEALGPIHLALPLVVDHAVAVMSDFAAGANINGQYYVGINWLRDLPLPPAADLRNVVQGDLSPDGQGVLQIKRGIEVGQIFQLGTKYSAALNATVQGENGQAQPLLMGCYGIGISRIVAAAIEQHHDKRGIVWPDAMAPFKVALLPINAHKSPRVSETAEQLYAHLLQAGIEVLFDDRPARPGVMLTDMDLLGIPYRVVVSDQHLANGQVECQQRRSGAITYLQLEQVVDFLLAH